MVAGVRTAAKRDAVEPSILAALRSAGYTVFQVSDDGIPDLLVCRVPPWPRASTQWLLLEVKAPGTTLTKAQAEFWSRTEGLPRFVVTNADAAVAAARYWLGGGFDA